MDTKKGNRELLKDIIGSECWNAQKTLERIEQSIYIFKQNYKELCEFNLNHQDYDSTINFDCINEFNRLLFNYLSSIFTFTEHTKLWFEKSNTPELPYNTEYLLVRELRNLSIHKEVLKTNHYFLVRTKARSVSVRINKNIFAEYLDNKIKYLQKRHKNDNKDNKDSYYGFMKMLSSSLQEFDEEIDVMNCCTKCYNFVLSFSGDVVEKYINENKRLLTEFEERTIGL